MILNLIQSDRADRRRLARLAWTAILVSGLLQPLSAMPQEDLLVVVNADSQDSLAVANHYIALRKVPARNVLYLSNVPRSEKDPETVGSAPWEAEIYQPINEAIQQRGLASQIRYIAYSADFPTRVVCQQEMNKYLANTGKEYSIHFHAPFLSLTSATYMGEQLLDPETRFLDPDANGYARPMSEETRAFSARPRWPTTPQDGAPKSYRYRLSTILAIVGERASTRNQAIRQLERSVSADFSKPEGRFYFAQHKDPRSKTRSDQFPPVAKLLAELGYEAEIGESTVPTDGADILGAVLGSPKLAWSDAKAPLVPGSICDNFTSYGGWFSKSQTLLTDFLEAGAAASVGTVYEPYTIPYKIPTAMTMVHYARGCTLAESLYQTIGNPFQLLIAGDPLCRPFARRAEFSVDGLSHRSVVEADITLSVQPKAGGPEMDHFELYVDGVAQVAAFDADQPVEIAIEDLSPGFHEVRCVAVDASVAHVRTGQTFDIFVRRDNPGLGNLKLEIAETSVGPDGAFLVKCDFPDGKTALVRQNHRTVGTLDRPNEPIRIDARDLGPGPSRLYVTLRDGDENVSGIPVEVMVESP